MDKRLLSLAILSLFIPAGWAACATLLFTYDTTVMCFDYAHFPTKEINPSVQVLVIKNNRLSTVPSLKFSRLYQLDLSWNLITTIESGAFSECKKLEVLDLSHNSLRNASFEHFGEVDKLRELNLGYNQLTGLFEGNILASNYGQLQNLNLTHNNLNFIDLGAFSSMENLETLDVSYNHIGDICFLEFKTMQRIQKLYLGHNRIRSLNATTFSGFHFLKTLKLDSNNINLVDEKAFWGLYSLEELDLRDNQLTTIPHAVRYFHSLRAFNLSYNPVTELPPMILPRSLETFSLEYCPTLRTVEDHAFLGLRNLKAVYISHNRGLTAVKGGAFDPLGRRIATVDLSDNRLETLDEETLEWGSTADLRLQGNPWRCDVRLAWLDSGLLARVSNSTRCTSPQYLSGKRLSEVDFERIIIESVNSAALHGDQLTTGNTTVAHSCDVRYLPRPRFRDPLYVALLGGVVILLAIIVIHVICRCRKSGVKYQNPTIEESRTYMDEPEAIHINVK